MAPRPNVSDERKKQILDAATTVFAKKGFADARMEDIANEARLSKATLYLYFKSKDDIIAAILDHFYNRGMQDLQVLQGYEGSITDLLLLLTRFFGAEAEEMMRMLPIAFEFYALAAYRLPHLQRANELIERLSYQNYRHTIVGSLSGGTKQKLNLTLALMHQPNVLLLDEPYQGFDWETYLRFWDLTSELRDQGCAVVIISHLFFEQKRFDVLYHLQQGRIAPEQVAAA